MSKMEYNKCNISTGLVILIVFFAGCASSSEVQKQATPVKQPCPYKCCIATEYLDKACGQFSDCIANVCQPRDTDKDGLTDEEEMKLGTNPNIADTDGDALSDYYEVRVLKTNPLNRNTDGDRYDDGQDPLPLVKSTANVLTTVQDKKWNWNVVNIAVVAITVAGSGGIAAVLAKDIVIANPSGEILIQNAGNDYSSYVNFDVKFSMMNTEISSAKQSISIGRLNEGQEMTKSFSREIKSSDLLGPLVDAVLKKTTNWDIYVENVEYETF